MGPISGPISLFPALGTGLAIYASYKICDWIWLYTRPSDLTRYLEPSGRDASWALVTGSSDGIGKAIAEQLAAQGFNVILHGRNRTKLEGVRDGLAKSHPERSFRIWVANASRCWGPEGEAMFDELLRLLRGEEEADEASEGGGNKALNLKILVNNAGKGPYPTFGALETYDQATILGTISLNATFPTLLSARLLPVLTGNSPSLLVNVGSVTDTGFPMVSFYGAAKSATHSLTLALAREVRVDWARKKGVEVISHRIGAVTAVSHQRTPPSLFVPAAETVARAILSKTGCGRTSVVPYLPHELQHLGLGLLPTWLSDRIIVKTMGGLRDEQDTLGDAASFQAKDR